MEDFCIICEHPAVEHWGTSCHKTSLLRGSCECTFVMKPSLPASANAAQYRQRSGWWEARVRITDDHIRRAAYGSPRRLRLEAFRKNAAESARRSLEMAELMEAAETRARAERQLAAAAVSRAAEEVSADAQRRQLLEQIDIANIESGTGHSLGLLAEQFDISPDAEREAVRARVEREYDGFEVSRKRELLDDEASRDFLEHIGVVSRWTIGPVRHRQVSTPPSPVSHPEVGSAAWADEMVRIATDTALGDAMAEAMREADAHMRFVQELDEEYGDTVGDIYWAQTEAEEGRMPRDETFIAEYLRTRSRVEAYWHNWTLAPSPELQRAFMANDPEGFKRHMTLAIQVLTPTEKFRFKSHDELFGWIASGMQPLMVGGDRVPLSDIVEARYLAMAV